MATNKILQLIGGGEIGGAEQHVLTFLQGFNPQAFSLTLGCLVDGPFARLAEEQGIETLRFPMKHALDLAPLPKLIRTIRRKNFDLIHTHGSRANLLGRLAGRYLKVPVVSTVHSSLKQDYLSPRAALLALTLDRLTLPLTSGIITVSEALAQEVAGRGGQNIRTIYNGIRTIPNLNSAEERKKLRENFRAAWQIPSDSVVLGSIARLHPTKGLNNLIEAARLLSNQFSKIHILIIGEGALHSKLEKQLNVYQLPHTLTGFLPQASLGLPAMDLFVLPSISEGMGLVLLEAMQAHLPVVATSVGGIPEVIRHNQDGLLVPPQMPEALAQACQQILLNPDLTEKFIRSGALRWQGFSTGEMLRQTENFYKEILSK